MVTRATRTKRRAARRKEFASTGKRTHYVKAGELEGISVRFHVERLYFRGAARSDDVWSRETLAGAKTLSGAKRDRAEIRREGPSYFTRDKFRIVKITTIREIVERTASKRRRPVVKLGHPDCAPGCHCNTPITVIKGRAKW